MNRRGFSLIELLVAIVIMGLLLGLGQAAYSVWQERVNLHNATEELKSTLVRLQQQAAASAEAKSWGAHLTSDEYIIFSGDIYNPTDPNNTVKHLSGLSIINPEASLSDGLSGFSPDIVFAKYTGQTINTGTITLWVDANHSATSSVVISGLGVIQ